MVHCPFKPRCVESFGHDIDQAQYTCCGLYREIQKKVFDTSFVRTTTTSFTVFHNTRAATVTSDKLNPEAQDTNIHVYP